MDCNLISTLNTSDYISVVGIIVNSLLAIWIVRTLQSNLANKRYLKDHLIQEIKNLRNEYSKFLNELNSGNMKPQKVAPWFKLMNIKVHDTMELVNEKYKIDKDLLKNYQVELRDLVTEFEEFNTNYRKNCNIQLGSQSLRDLIQFQQKNQSKFNKLIININDK